MRRQFSAVDIHDTAWAFSDNMSPCDIVSPAVAPALCQTQELLPYFALIVSPRSDEGPHACVGRDNVITSQRGVWENSLCFRKEIVHFRGGGTDSVGFSFGLRFRSPNEQQFLVSIRCLFHARA